MSIGGLMRTSVSGMNAQATRLAGVSENIANANTTGYKRQTTEFSALVLASGTGRYTSGVVEANTRQLVSEQGGLSYTVNSSTSQAVDLAIQGKGMLVVSDGAGGTFLTRAGSFVKNGNGDLVNAAGYILQGYPLPMDDTAGVLNGFADLQNVNLNASQLRLKPTDSGIFRVNLPIGGEAVDESQRPGENGGEDRTDPVKFNHTDSIVVYDDAGQEVILDIYMTKTGEAADGSATWEYAVFDRAQASTGNSAPFPYNEAPRTRVDVSFDPSGKMTAPDPASFAIDIPNGREMRLDIGGTTQVGAAYQPLAATVNGNPPGSVDQIVVGDDGTVSARFRSGELVGLFKIPLAMVESPDNLRSMPGNVFVAGRESGEVLLGFGGESGLGSLVHGALEQSTVDLASELTTMIESQRSYTANSKVFQTGSEILDVLVNLKR
ncbi:flagellar hook protein FlgE [Aureimonas mangrovi]|uniref:flagellar hook protein FlgE n=1 Tax=Aureimonas mangrovi TaxID=2758041 RepID=UPI001AED9B6A|nr:flagellar hook protein FlgE [Aureimonas mangrovi]